MTNVSPSEAGEYVLEDQIGFLLRLAMQRHAALFLTKMVDGLTQAQFAALAKLHKHGECTQIELGRLISLDGSTINGIVTRMKQRELITVTPSPTDGRSRLLAISEKGREVVERAIPAAEAATRDTMLPLNGREAASVIAVLKKLV